MRGALFGDGQRRRRDQRAVPHQGIGHTGPRGVAQHPAGIEENGVDHWPPPMTNGVTSRFMADRSNGGCALAGGSQW